MKDLPIIQSLWIGKKLSTLERLSITSFLENGHPFHLYLYEEVEGIPRGVIIKEASEVVSNSSKDKFMENGHVANFSDMFRYKLLFEKGGYWVDTDVVSLKPFTFNQEYIFACETYFNKFKNKEISQVASCVIKASRGSEIMDYCYGQSIQKSPSKLSWDEIGPKLLTKAVSEFNMQKYVTNNRAFCPIPWTHFYSLISDKLKMVQFKKLLENSFAIHFWNELWRREGVDKTADFPAESIYEKLKVLYLKK